MDSLIPVLFRVGFGLLFIGIGVFTVFGPKLLRNTQLEEDIDTGNTVVHRWYHWYNQKWETSLGATGYGMYKGFWGIVIGVMGLLILFGFIDLSNA